MAATMLATTDDVAAIWHDLSATEESRVTDLIGKASAKLRHAAPFDVDARMALYDTDPTNPIALDPLVVADVVATVVKRFLVNQDGYASTSQTVGPYSQSGTFVNRYDKTGSDVRGAIQITESDIDQLRPAVPASVPSSFKVGVPCPQLLIPAAAALRGVGGGLGMGVGPAVMPDYTPGVGTE